MYDPAPSPRRLRFGPFELDVRSGELCKGATRLKVPAQSIEILIALTDVPGELVSREQLRARLWGSETFVDFEQGLNAAVRRLRESLGDSAAQPRYIETLPRRGYRFIGSVVDVPLTRPAPIGAASSSVEDIPRAGEPPKQAAAAAAPRHVAAIVGLVMLTLLAVATFLVNQHQARLAWARTTAPREAARLIDEQDFESAFRVAERALAVDPDNTRLRQLVADISKAASITSDPPGVDVFVRGYRPRSSGWRALGRTPIAQARVPRGLVEFRATRDGFEPFHGASHWGRPFHFVLVPSGRARGGMVWVPGGDAQLIGGPTVSIEGFWMDRLEVTNREFQAFVDAGGYRSPRYWTEPFFSNGRRLTWHEAVQHFTDSTGRPGPATWELGAYPRGLDDYPVTGVSWYEAAAYLAFAGKSMPTAFHWRRAAGTDLLFSDIIPVSNFGGRGPAPVGRHRGLGAFGTFDMAGNAKEWCFNDTDGRRVILGGAWKDEPYVFAMVEAFPPMERQVTFGIRGMRESTPSAGGARASVTPPEAAPPVPVDLDVYRSYAKLFAHDRAPVEPRVDAVDDTNPYWRRETVSFLGPDGIDRVPAVLFVPRNASPPFQVAIFVPGADAEMLRSRADMNVGWIDVVARSGRAVLHPIYKGTFERGVALNAMGPNTWRDTRIVAIKEMGRAIDWIETRPDLDASRIAVIGLSNGAMSGLISSAIEPRLRTSVLLGAGLVRNSNVPPELDAVNYAPHVRVPTLMINGRWDFVLPYTTAQVALFQLLGTPSADKRHATFPGGHVPLRRQDMVRELLTWLDTYLGAVRSSPLEPRTNE